MQITTYYGSSRKATKWKPRHEEWADFAARFETPIRTAESLAEYRSMTKKERGVAKDVGGFVGGVLSDHRRSKNTIQRRTLITLDADQASMDLVTDFLCLGLEGLIYSTHSHTPEHPKLRIVIPMANTLTPDQYPGVVNYFAHILGVDQFDPTSDEPERLMYWPSCPKDGEYIYEKSQGEIFDGLAFLEAQPQWADSAMWVLSAKKQKKAVERGLKAQNPLEKKGVIGAFCRSFDIHEAISKWLPDVYEYSDEESGRYTYVPGSTSNGVHTHEDLWSYSHHGTDPAGGILCNAWDLVRIHKFDGDDGAMRAFASELPDVVQDLALEAFRAEKIESGLSVEDTAWMRDLSYSARGVIQQTIGNALHILNNDVNLKGRLRYNEITDRAEPDGGLPWRRGATYSWGEHDMSQLFAYMEGWYGLEKTGVITHALNVVLSENRYNPVLEYLDGLQWDGVERLDSFLIEYMGAEDSEYVRTVTRKWMTAAVKRVFEPGCQFDYMLVLHGPQGFGKSQLLQRLGGTKWFTDSVVKLDGSKESSEQIRGFWIVCADELSAMRKMGEQQEAIKNFITRRTDSYRPAYGRFVEDVPRRCVFAGTTNQDEFLRDYTGNRRFWVVQTTKKDPRLWTDEFPRDQLWAEACMSYMLGEDLYLNDKMEAEAKKVQERYMEKDDQMGELEEYLRAPIPKDFYERDKMARRDWYVAPDPNAETMERKSFSAKEVWVEFLGGNLQDFPKRKQYEVNGLLKACQFLESGYTCRISGYGKQRVYQIV